MTQSKYTTRSRVRSKSRSRSPPNRVRLNLKTDTLSPTFRRHKIAESESLPSRLNGNHSSRALNSQVSQRLDVRPLLRSRPRNTDDKDFSDMDYGPTVVDNFQSFFIPPLIYDSIRPAHSGRKTETLDCRDNQSSSNFKIIPIHVEHIVPEKPPETTTKSENGTIASPITVDDITVDLVKPANEGNSSDNFSSQNLSSKPKVLRFGLTKRTDKVADDEWKSVTNFKIMQERLSREKEDQSEIVVDLTETPKVINTIIQPKGQTPIDQRKGSWTVIPVHHIKKEPAKDSEPICVLIDHKHPEKVTELQRVPPLRQNCKENLQSASYLPENQELHSDNNRISSTRWDSSPSDNPFDLLPLGISKKLISAGVQELLESSALPTDLSPGDSLLAEKDVNPTPSYPIYDVLKDQLSKENRKIDYIRGDGNCFFRTLSKQLYGTERYHKALRSLVVDIMATNRSSFVQFIDGGNVQVHLDRMSEENTWATTCEIYAAATLVQREIYMLTPNHDNTCYSWLLFKPLFKIDSKLEGSKTDDQCYLTVCNTNGNHYDRVVPDHGGCNCFLPLPHLDGQSGTVDLT